MNSIISGHGSRTGKTADESTVGIKLRPWHLQDTTVEFFDCAGHADYARMYQTFLTRRALYLVVLDITKYHDLNNLDEVCR